MSNQDSNSSGQGGQGRENPSGGSSSSRRRRRRPRRRGGRGRGDGSGNAKVQDAPKSGSAGNKRPPRKRSRRKGRGGAKGAKPEAKGAKPEAKGDEAPRQKSGPQDGPARQKSGPQDGQARRKRSRRRKRRPQRDEQPAQKRRDDAVPNLRSGSRSSGKSQRPRRSREPDDAPLGKLIGPEKAQFLTASHNDPSLLIDDEPTYDWPDRDELFNVVTVRFSHGGRVEDFDSGERIYRRDEYVIIETEKGLQIGTVTVASRLSMRGSGRLPRVIRGMNETDDRQERRNRGKEQEARDLCLELARKYRLRMKLIAVDYLHGGNRAVFYFSAEGRIDFRQLVRDLASRLHTRIEMRQVGVRDASRFLGGIGPCGHTLCCSSFLRRFAPVSIRMAKDQNLVLNPQKVSGICGRLMCCLTYEEDGYVKLRKGLPKPGRRVTLTSGEHARVRDVDVLRQQMRVELEDGTSRNVTIDEIERPRGGGGPKQGPPTPSKEASDS